MKNRFLFSRRTLVKSSVLGLLSVALPSVIYAKEMRSANPQPTDPDKLFHRYPSIDDEIVSEIVGASHFNFDRVKELVSKRPELARATWDWAFGDWETALGAASHVGRRDIATFLMEHGARPDIFTYAMFGAYEAVKEMIEATPGIQSIDGPHGISLLQHAKVGLRQKDEMSNAQIENAERLIDYLDSLGDADGKTYQEMTEDKEQYLGDYKYGDGEKEGFSVKLNMRKMITLGKLGSFGGALLKISENRFAYNGTTSVEVSFQRKNDKIVSLTVHEPDLVLKAVKV